MTYQRGWATMSSVLGGVPGQSARVVHTFATGPVHALQTGSHVALCDPTLPIIDSTIREGWPPVLGEVCPDCAAAADDQERIVESFTDADGSGAATTIGREQVRLHR